MNGTLVFAVPDFEPTLGGTTRQTGNLARAMQRRGDDVVIVTQRIDTEWPRTETIGGVTVHRLGPRSRGPLGMKLFVWNVAWWLFRRRRSIGVVQVVMYPDLVLSAKLAGLAPRTVMCWAGLGDATDTITNGHAILRSLRRRALAPSHQIALTQAIAAELERADIGSDVNVLPIPVDRTRFRPPTTIERREARTRCGAGGGTFVVVYCGHLRALKRVELLVDAFATLVESGTDARLLIVGGSRADLDDTTNRIVAEIQRLDLAGRVVLAGAVDDVVPYLHAADAFVLPSDREGMSNSLLEALACGVPCIAPPSAGGDQILDATCGLVPPSNRPADLARALMSLAADPARVDSLREGAARRAAPFALDAVGDRYGALYESVRHGGGSRTGG